MDVEFIIGKERKIKFYSIIYRIHCIIETSLAFSRPAVTFYLSFSYENLEK